MLWTGLSLSIYANKCEPERSIYLLNAIQNENMI